MKLVALTAFAVLVLVIAAPAGAKSLPAEPPDFVDRYVVSHPVETPDFVDRYVVGHPAVTPDFVDRYVVSHPVVTPDFVDRFVVGQSQSPPDFVDRFVARETAPTTVASPATASSSDEGRTVELAVLLGMVAAMLAAVTVALRRRVPQPV